MRILYLHNMTQISGGERSLLNLWENLDRQKFEPFLIVPQEGQLSRAAQTLGISVSFLEAPQLQLKNCLKLLLTATKLHSFLKDNRINIIHSYSPRNNVLSALVAKLSGIPVIWHERNLIYQNEMDVSQKLMFLADRIICNSQAVARRFEGKKDYYKKVRVVLNGVHQEKFKASEEDGQLKSKLGLEGKRLVGMVTNLNKRKRVEFLIQTMPLVIERLSDVQFLIIGGEFPDERGLRLKELKKLAYDLNVQNHLIFTDFQDDVRPYLNILDLFVHVTLKEACSRAILEAMACSKAVIAINDGGNPELVEDGKTGFLVDPDDSKELAAKIIKLLLDEQLRKDMGQAARVRGEQLFCVKRNAKETQDIYLECQA